MDVDKIDIKSPEFIKLENENKELKSELSEIQDIKERLLKLEQHH